MSSTLRAAVCSGPRPIVEEPGANQDDVVGRLRADLVQEADQLEALGELLQRLRTEAVDVTRFDKQALWEAVERRLAVDQVPPEAD